MIKILTIDGGGIRGVLPGQILTKLEYKLAEALGNPHAKIGDYFDMIAGTSTGGILTAFLLCPGEDGKAKYTAKEAVSIYLEKGSEIFESSLSKVITSGAGLLDEKYDVGNLEKILKEKLGEDTWLSDLIKPCLITAYDVESRRAFFFNQFEANEKQAYNFKAWEIARATSAAPTYFQAAKIKNYQGDSFALIDGGVFANNPALCAYVEARNNFKKANDKSISAKDIFLVSLGTGSIKKPYMYNHVKDYGVAQWVKPLVDIMMSGSAETVDFQLKNIFESEGVLNQYVRIEPNMGASDNEMDNVSAENLQALKVAGEDSAAQFEDRLDYIVEQLIKEDVFQS